MNCELAGNDLYKSLLCVGVKLKSYCVAHSVTQLSFSSTKCGKVSFEITRRLQSPASCNSSLSKRFTHWTVWSSANPTFLESGEIIFCATTCEKGAIRNVQIFVFRINLFLFCLCISSKPHYFESFFHIFLFRQIYTSGSTLVKGRGISQPDCSERSLAGKVGEQVLCEKKTKQTDK